MSFLCINIFSASYRLCIFAFPATHYFMDVEQDFCKKMWTVFLKIYDRISNSLGIIFYAITSVFGCGESNILSKNEEQIIPKSVNYHFTRRCNYTCGFCFHTEKTSYMTTLEDAKTGFDMLRKAGKSQKLFQYII